MKWSRERREGNFPAPGIGRMGRCEVEHGENAVTGNIAGVFRCLREYGRGTFGHRPGSVSCTAVALRKFLASVQLPLGLVAAAGNWGLAVQVHVPAVRLMKAKRALEMTEVLALR
jgi:hypothetical protein